MDSNCPRWVTRGVDRRPTTTSLAGPPCAALLMGRARLRASSSLFLLNRVAHVTTDQAGSQKLRAKDLAISAGLPMTGIGGISPFKAKCAHYVRNAMAAYLRRPGIALAGVKNLNVSIPAHP